MKNKIRKLSYLKDTLANSYQNFSTFTPHKKFCYIHLDSYMKIAVAPTSKAVFTIHPTLPACPSLLPWQLQSTQSLSLVARQAIAPTTKSRYVYCKLRSCAIAKSYCTVQLTIVRKRPEVSVGWIVEQERWSPKAPSKKKAPKF